MRFRRTSARPLVLAHRGASATHVENTMAAFEEAIRVGADGVELDVHRCATGEVVVFHDYDLQRLAGRADKIKDLTLTELRDAEVDGGHRIPTLVEALDLLRDKAVNIEIKTPAVGRAGKLVDAVARDLERVGAHDRVLLSSFDPIAVLQVRRRYPALLTGYLFHGKQALPLREAWPSILLRPFAVHPQYRLCDKRRLSRWRRAGYAINVWTVDEPEQLHRLARHGVDAVVTNDPARSLAALT